MISLWGFPVKSGNLPWVLLLLSVLTGGDPFHDLIGIAAGHTYIYLKLVLPQSHGYDFLKTPKLLEKWVLQIMRRFNARPPGGVRNLNNDRVNVNNNNNNNNAGGGQGDDGGAFFRAFGGRGVRLGGN